jgi:hypothetical protein
MSLERHVAELALPTFGGRVNCSLSRGVSSAGPTTGLRQSIWMPRASMLAVKQ